MCQLDWDPSQQKSHWKYHRFLALDKYQMIELQKGKIFRHLDIEKLQKDFCCENWSLSKKEDIMREREDIMREREGWNLFYFPFLPSSHGNGCAPGTLWTSEFFPFLELLIFNSLQVIHLPKMIPWIFCICWHAKKLCQTDHSQSNFAFYAPLPSWHDLVLACWCQRSQNNCCTSTSSPFIDTDTLGRPFKIKLSCTK